MANQFLDNDLYANVMLYLVKNQLVMGRCVDTKFTNQVTDENGLRINVKRPPRFVFTQGPTLDVQDIVTGSTDIEVDQYSGVHLKVTDLQYVQSFNQLLRTQTMRSAASTIAQGLDSFLHGQLRKFPSWVNAPAEGTATDLPIRLASDEVDIWTRMEELAVPNSDRCGVMATRDAASIQKGLIDSNTLTAEARSALRNARIPILSDINYYRTQATSAVTNGTRADATNVNGANQNVNYEDVKDSMTQELVVEAAGNAGTFKAGEVFSIAGVFRVNPRTQQIVTDQNGNNVLMQFTVVDDVAADGSGNATLTISPPIIVPNTGASLSQQRVNTAFATASAAPANDAAITFAGDGEATYQVRAAWHKSAIQLVSARLITPMTGESSFATDPETGISIRYWRGSDINTGQHIHRWDMIYGAEVVDPLLGTRFSGTSAP